MEHILALELARELTTEQIDEWRQLAARAVRMGLAEEIETFSSFHQSCDGVAYHTFIMTIGGLCGYDGDLDDELLDNLADIVNTISVGSGIHPKLVDAYISCLVEQRVEAFVQFYKNGR